MLIFTGNAAYDAFAQLIGNTSICLAQAHKLRRRFNETDAEKIIRLLTVETRSRGNKCVGIPVLVLGLQLKHIVPVFKRELGLSLCIEVQTTLD